MSGCFRETDRPPYEFRQITDFRITILGIIRSKRQCGFEFLTALRSKTLLSLVQYGKFFKKAGGFFFPVALNGKALSLRQLCNFSAKFCTV